MTRDTIIDLSVIKSLIILHLIFPLAFLTAQNVKNLAPLSHNPLDILGEFSHALVSIFDNLVNYVFK